MTSQRDSENFPLFGKVVGVSIIIVFLLLTIQRNFIWQDPLKLWQDAAAKSPNKPRPRLAIGDIHHQLGADAYRKGELNTARAELETAIVNYQDVVNMHYDTSSTYLALTNIAAIYQELGRNQEAFEILVELFRSYPDDATTIVNLTVAYLRANDPSTAMNVIQYGLERHPDDGHLWFNKGEICRMTHDCDCAAASYTRAETYLDFNTKTNAEYRRPVCIEAKE